MKVPAKKRLRSPARASASRRVFTRVTERNPHKICACSRSMTRRSASSCKRWRSRSCRTMPDLFPITKNLLAALPSLRLSLCDFFLYLGALTRKASARTLQQIGIVDLGFSYRRGEDSFPMLLPGLHYELPWRQVLQEFGE